MKKKLLVFVLLAWGVSSQGCESATDNTTDDPQTEEPNDNPNDDPEEVLDYPSGITVEEFTDTFSDGGQCLGFIVKVDFSKNEDLQMTVANHLPMKVPSDVYSAFTSGTPAIVINGGYFSGITSMSLAVTGGSVKCNNVTAINWPSDEVATYTVYPVRSAFGMMADGTFEAQWAYCVNTSSKLHYGFPSALGNDEQTSTFMTSAPTTETEGGVQWSPQEAIGGGPRLVENGVNVANVNYWKEVLDAGGTAGYSRQPRTAIGATEGNILIMIVADGRSMRDSDGYTLSELADKFISLGATNAINLDGGGSSCIVGKDGEVLNRPSDSGTTGDIVERKISTSVTISTK